nr:non-ribosomal peptide synthase [Okeania sp. VPG18-21]
MKTTKQLLSELSDLGVKLWVEKERLQYSAPKGKMTSILRAELVERKAEILILLRQAQQGTNTDENSIKPIKRDSNTLPLSFAQQRLWFIEKTGVSRNAYNVSLTLSLEGKLDIVALQKSINQIIARHETLRTKFTQINGIPTQVIKPPFELELPTQDLSNLTPYEQTTQLQHFLLSARQQQFDLEKDFPIQVQLLKLGATEHILQVTLHHIASDGWSLTVFAKELSAHYTAALQNQPSPLPKLAIQYADFAVWQREYLQGTTLQTQLDYWKQKLLGLPKLQLPIDYPRPAIETFKGASCALTLSPSLTSKLKQLTQQQGVTLFMTLLAGFKVLLHRYSGQESISVGSLIANRNRSEIEDLIGFFVNSLVMYTDLGGEPSFTEVLRRVRQTAIEAYAHQDLPFEKLVEELQPERSLSHNPLFQVMFALQQSELINPSFSLPNLEVGWYRGAETEVTVRVDLELHLWQEGEEINGYCAYNRDLFAADTIKRMLTHYENILSAAVETPEQPINLLPILSAKERQKLLVGWNKTQIDYPTNKCIHELFAAQVEKSPDAVALVFEEQELTYSQLNRKANQLAHELQRLGVVPEVLVGICVQRSVEMVVGLLAILKAGGAYVPLDPNYPRSRLSQILEQAQLHMLLTDSQSQSQLPATETSVILIDKHLEVTANPSTHPVSDVQPQNLAYVLFTSGSTGRPKGVAIEHRSPVCLVSWAQTVFDYEQLSGVLASTSICFDLSVFELFVPLSCGGKVILAQNALYLPSLPAAEQVRLINTVPSAARELIRSNGIPSSVGTVNLAGEPLDQELVDALYQQSTIKAVYNLYGPSEDTTYSTFALMALGVSPTIGRPIANTQTYILDDKKQPVPVGVAGELYLAGVGLARGYLNQPQLTEEKFIAHPFSESPDAKVYKTGDLVRYLCDGQIEYLGRQDHQVKIRGFRIEIGEIETVMRQNPTVKEAVVVARSEEVGEQRLFAYIVPEVENLSRDNSELLETQLSSWQEIFNQQIDLEANAITDPLFNISGWRSSYDNEPIPETQMREWSGDIITQVLAQKPQTVCEIGCGTGMLLFQIAPHTQSYYGTDISNASLDYIRKQIEQQPDKYAHVTLAQKAAESMTEIVDNSFDVVLLSSIVQYFPSVEYLLQIIENSIRIVKPGGVIFLGDIRSFPLMKAFHTSVQLHKATPSLSVKQLRQRIDKVMLQEKELLVSPELFVALKDKYPEITHVQIRLQRGRENNELNKYRYNVLLHIEAKPESVIRALVENGADMSVPDIEAYLGQNKPEAICFSSLANERVATDIAAVDSLSQVSLKLNVQQLRQKLQLESVNGIDLEQLYQLSESLGYSLELCWSVKGQGFMDAVLVKSTLAAEAIVLTPLTQKLLPEGNWYRYCNNPLVSESAKQLIPQWKQYLLERLPEYMIPSGYVVLSQLPLTPNGKVDRKALPTPEARLEGEFVLPRDTIESQLAKIWSEVLNVHPIGVQDNFFELGGHSLIAVRLMSQVEKHFGKNIPLAILFQAQTIEQLANILRQSTDSFSWSPLVPIQPNGSKRPFFCVPGAGGNVMYFSYLARYLGSDQPFYGLQAVGLDGESAPYTRVEDMAAYNIKEIQSIQPQGPYLLGGHSFGAKVAFEMAQQLQKQGQKVALLAILDSTAPEPENKLASLDIAWNDAIWLIAITETLGIIFGKELEVYYEAIEGLTPDEQLNYVYKKLQQINVFPPGTGIKQLRGYIRVIKTHFLCSYFPKEIYPTQITLFRSELGPVSSSKLVNILGKELFESPRPESMSTEDFGWSGFSAGQVDIYQVPGDHVSMIAEPHVQVFAPKLIACIEQAQAKILTG